MPEELPRAVTLQQVYNRAHKKHRLQQRLQRVKNTNIQHKDPNHTEDRIRPSMDKIQIGLRVLKITSGVHNPAQAKPEGNFANVVTSNLRKSGHGLPTKGGEETKEKERRG